MPTIHYGFDAYCGWCYGFDSIFTEFLHNHPEIAVEIHNGGLFIGDNSKVIGDYGFFQEGNKQITTTYGIEFGDAYNAALETGTMVLNSVHPALALIVMKQLVDPTKIMDLAYAIQQQSFVHGKNLSQIHTFSELAPQFDIGGPNLIEKLEEAWNTPEIAMEEFKKTYQMGAQSYPTVIVEVNGSYYNLLQGARTLADIEANYLAIAV